VYVALKRQRFGDRMLEPGDEVPFEPSRNYNLMLRQGMIADLEQVNASKEGAKAAQDAAKARIDLLEGLLADANEEIKGLREQLAASSDGTEAEAATEGESPAEVNLSELSRDALLEHAEGLGLTIPSRASKPKILEAIQAAGE
jgi:hypothetical protein